MVQANVNIGNVPDDGLGDPLRTGFTNINNNFTELYNSLPHPGFVSGRRYPIYPTLMSTVAANGTVNTIKLIPFILPRVVTIQGLFTRCITAQAGSNIQFAIFAGNLPTCRPTGTAVAYTGNVSTAATGIVGANFSDTGGSGANTTFQPGLYFMGLNSSNNSSQFHAPDALTSQSTFIMGGNTDVIASPGTTQAMMYLTTSQIFNSWSTLTGALFIETNSGGMPMVYFRVA